MLSCLFLVLPEVMFHNEQVILDPLSLQQDILTKFVVCQHPVSKDIGFGDERTGETTLEKQIIK